MLLIGLAAFFGLFMAWGIGANDVANAMGTSVGSKALTIKQAIVIAMIFEFAGAYLAGGEVTSTIRKGIIDSGYFTDTPELLVLGMISALFAAGTWLLVASLLGWPVSTTHSIVGAIIGFAVVGVSIDAVAWNKVAEIMGSWVITPAIAGLIAYLLYKSAEQLIFKHKTPFKRAQPFVPIYIAFAAFVMALVTIKKGLKHVGLDLPDAEGYMLATVAAVVIGLIGKWFVGKIKLADDAAADVQERTIERIFAVLMVVTACCMAFAHGSNDVANAIGPVAAVVNIVQSGGEISGKSALSPWILPLGGFGIVLGLAMLGQRVIKTIGEKITHLTPSRGFAAELAAASTVVIASGVGLPISTTQTLVGAVLGVGMAQGIKALNLAVIKKILISWVVTLPAGAVLSITFFFVLSAILL
jgi:PiT family inorganic phosphate transporter